MIPESRLDNVVWRAHGHVDKFTIDQVEACRQHLNLDREPLYAELIAFCSPDDYVDAGGNLLTTIGVTRLANRFVGTASNQALDATHCRIGVGNGGGSVPTPLVGDTDLTAASGSGNRQFVLVDSAPVVSGGQITFVATHTTGLSNFAWNEWGIDGGIANGTTVTADTNTAPGLVNHKGVSLGTKTVAASWAFTVTITLS